MIINHKLIAIFLCVMYSSKFLVYYFDINRRFLLFVLLLRFCILDFTFDEREINVRG